MTAAPVVSVRGLARAYGTRLALAGADVTLHPGERLALVGGNGGGKTTLLRLLAGLLRPDDGEGQVLGLPIATAGRRIAARAGYMPQRLALYPDLPVHENLRFHAALRGAPAASIGALAERFGFERFMQTQAGALSEGWARRVQLAACLLGAPKLALLDEPTAGLDPLARDGVWAMIASLGSAGTAVIVSTHDLQEAQSCDKVMMLLDGKVVAEGAPRELIAQENTRDLTDLLRRKAA